MEMSNRVLEWSEKVRQQANSGLNIATWCRDNSIPYQTFFYWKKRLGIPKESLKADSFVEMPQANTIEISLPEVKLTLSMACDLSALPEILKLLSRL